jgi:hypothetical protein
LVVAAPLPGLATELFDPSFASCTGTNCSSITIGGVVNAFGGQPKPWTAEFRATAGRCLRLDVLTQGADLEIVAVAPDGSVYRNDDTVGLLPQVRINPTNSGFYTVQIAQYAGSVTETSFTLAFGQYNLGNPNCLGATTPERRAVVTTKTRAN